MREFDPWGDALTRRLAALAFCIALALSFFIAIQTAMVNSEVEASACSVQLPALGQGFLHQESEG